MEALYKALTAYFTKLSNYGYHNYKETEDLILYTFLVEVLASGCDISEEDQRFISDTLNNLQGTSCIFGTADCCTK